MAAATAGLFWLALLDASSTWTGTVLPAAIVMSLGLGAVFVPLSSVTLSGVEPNDTGVASALLNMAQQVGGALGVALLNALYAASVSGYLATESVAGRNPGQFEAFLHGYRTAFTAGGCLFAAALLVFLAVGNSSAATAMSTTDAVPDQR